MFSEIRLRTFQLQKKKKKQLWKHSYEDGGETCKTPGSEGKGPVQSHFLPGPLSQHGRTVLKPHSLSKAAQDTEVLLMRDYCVLKQD